MYKPSEKILDKYADLLVNFALKSCKGVKKGEVVLLQVPECAKPMLVALRRAVLKAGANAITNYIPDGIDREFYELANNEQLDYFPSKLLKGRIDEIDHIITMDADSNPKELEGIDAKKIMRKSKAFRPYMEWRDDKENMGKFSWTVGLYGTEAMAKEAGMTIEEYWNEIIKGCYLDVDDSVKKWKEITKEIERIKDKLNNLYIEKLRVKAKDTDLIIGLGKDRKWVGGEGANIPSFEVFTSPDFRKTEGKIRFTEPLYSYGNLIKNVYLEFKDGKVVKAEAETGNNVLNDMINTDEGARRVGEYSLTDARLSRITKFMAATLFDENVGGKFGNTHLALGKAYKECYTGDASKVPKGKWKELGYNESAIHEDIVAISNREVTAYLFDGTEKTIYNDGKFSI